MNRGKRKADIVQTPSSSARKLAVSAYVGGGTGIGVIQRVIYPRLARRGLQLLIPEGSENSGRHIAQALRRLRNFVSLGPLRVPLLSVTSPLPLFATSSSVVVVHDLRWRVTRGRVARAYRNWDLKRTVRRAGRIICVSERTRSDLVAYLPSSENKSRVAWLGPGIVPPGSFSSNDSGIVLLIGGAAHKRNEYAARLLAEANPLWMASIVGVGVSLEVRNTLQDAFGATRCRWLSRISDDLLVELYKQAQYFVLLSVEEGFGMPYVEALSAGCQVVAIDQPLTREILGPGGILISEGSAADVIDQLREIQPLSIGPRERRASLYSWDRFAAAIEECLDFTNPSK